MLIGVKGLVVVGLPDAISIVHDYNTRLQPSNGWLVDRWNIYARKITMLQQPLSMHLCGETVVQVATPR